MDMDGACDIHGHKRVTWPALQNSHAHHKFSAYNEIRIIMTGQYTKCIDEKCARPFDTEILWPCRICIVLRETMTT